MICTMCKNRGIGFQNELPWSMFKTDMKFFNQMTTGNKNNAVIMGKNTFLSILNKNNKPLQNRTNLIISSGKFNLDHSFDELLIFNNISLLINHCYIKKYEEVWIIGGEKLYGSMLKNKLITISEIYLTYIDKEYNCDTFLPELPGEFKEKTTVCKVYENDVNLYFTKFSSPI